jgi:hypothetical protein
MSRTGVQTSGMVPEASSASAAWLERHVHQPESVERLLHEAGAARHEQHALEVRREPRARHGVAQRGTRERELRLRVRQWPAGTRGDDRERHAVAHLERPAAEHLARELRDGHGHVLRTRPLGVVLVADVRIRQPVEGRHRVGLGQRRHPPGTDRGADQLELEAGPAEPFAVEQLVERDQREALRAAGSGRDAGDVGRCEAVLPHVRRRAGAGPERNQ